MNYTIVKQPKIEYKNQQLTYKDKHVHQKVKQFNPMIQNKNQHTEEKIHQTFQINKSNFKKHTVMIIESKIKRKLLQSTSIQNNQILKDQKIVYLNKSKNENDGINQTFENTNNKKLKTFDNQSLSVKLSQVNEYIPTTDLYQQNQKQSLEKNKDHSLEQRDQMVEQKKNQLTQTKIKSSRMVKNLNLDNYELILQSQKNKQNVVNEDKAKKSESIITPTKELIHRFLKENTKQQPIKKILQNQQDKYLILEKEIQERVSLFLSEDSLKKTYYSRPWEEKEVLRHWGQRKLLLIEIYFLVNWGHLSKNIVYVGAAPGQHIAMLSVLFKDHFFILYDPNEFQIQQRCNITIIQKYFNENDASSLQQIYQGNYLFISDIRTANYKDMNPLENEQQIIQDNLHQMRWVQIMKPKKSILKFRCTYPTQISEPTEFFQGQLLIQPWAPQSSTETRLIPDDTLEKRLYNNKIYEEQLFFHNDETRKYFHLDLDSNIDGMDGGWDSCAEWLILSQYIKKFRQFNNLKRDVEQLSLEITASIQTDSSQRHLSDKKKKNK